MARERAVADAELGDASESGLHGGQDLGLEHRIDLVAGVNVRHVAAYVSVEDHRVDDAVGVFAVAADGDVHVEADILIDDSERNGRRSAVLVAGDLLDVEVVDPLIASGDAAELESLPGVLDGFLETLEELASEDGRRCLAVVDEFAGFCAEFRDFAVLDDHHALSFVDGDDRLVGDYVVLTLGVAGTRALVMTCRDQYISGQSILIEILFPSTA